MWCCFWAENKKIKSFAYLLIITFNTIKGMFILNTHSEMDKFIVFM